MRRFYVFLLNGILLTATAFLMKSIGFSFSIYISKKVGAEALGVFHLIMSVYMFCTTFATSGISLSVTRIVVEKTAFCKDADTRPALRKCFGYSLFFGILACVLLITFAKPIAYYFVHNQVPYYLFYWIGISLPFISLSSCFNGYFTALRKNGKNATNRVFEQILKMIATAYFLSFFLPSNTVGACKALVLGEMISEIGSCLFAVVLYKWEVQKHTKKQPEHENYLKKIASISLPVAITSYIRSGLSSLKQLLIPTYLEKSGLSCSDAISSYGMISGMVMPILLFPEVIISSFSGLVVPEYAYFDTRKAYKRITDVTQKIFRITFFFSVAVLGVCFFYSKEISFAIYQNFEIANYLKILSPLIFFMYLDSIVDNILKGLNKQMDVMKCNILDLFTSILFICCFLPIWGLHGYIMVIYISELLNSSISLYQLKKVTHFKIDWKNWLIKPLIRNCRFVFVGELLNTSYNFNYTCYCIANYCFSWWVFCVSFG